MFYFILLNIMFCKKFLCGNWLFNLFQNALNIWQLNFVIYEKNCDFLIYMYFLWFIICDLVLLIFEKHVDKFKCFCNNKLDLDKPPIIQKYYCHNVPNQIYIYYYIKVNNQMGVFHLNFGNFLNFGKGNWSERIKQNFIDRNIFVVFNFFCKYMNMISNLFFSNICITRIVE